LLPCIDYQLRPVEGITEGGRLYISGPNVMMGYMFSHTPGEIQPPEDGWHDTGDIVSIDKEGYITIKGRAKRFAKIAGEMVSLTAVEDALYTIWPQNQHAVLCRPDAQKGEQIILVTNAKNADKKQLIHHFKTKGLADIALPRRIIILDKLPVLGSGKVDYQAVKFIIENNPDESVEEDENDVIE
jgi:acyl-[acyl-carrier-protein]-phospholipid O-acyltransferase/long-chain-fatty-acid--[acyl-carrier-protein] ligase